MPRFRRTDRINEQLKQEISLIVRDEVRDPRVGLATITAVITSPELDHARVYVTSLGDEKEREGIIEGLRSAAAFIRKQLSGRLHMRRVPELHFEADRVLAEASRIEELLRQALPPELRNQPLDADEADPSADADDLDDAEDPDAADDPDETDDLEDADDAADSDDDTDRPSQSASRSE
ncbi:MAG TPA: 30S ribosome-binding factor RbfA [Longimicrobium sp.]|jgi:ribosome-binding factor A|uniref:30S ribosome-binding factor RbfA n=1 Tax=Longimicrobium sp. TaxID=2029185 RepID=UPI002EDB75ED